MKDKLENSEDVYKEAKRIFFSQKVLEQCKLLYQSMPNRIKNVIDGNGI